MNYILKQKISNCLWFDSQAEDAAKFYTSIFKNSKIGRLAYYGKEGFEIHERENRLEVIAGNPIIGQNNCSQSREVRNECQFQ